MGETSAFGTKGRPRHRKPAPSAPTGSAVPNDGRSGDELERKPVDRTSPTNRSTPGPAGTPPPQEAEVRVCFLGRCREKGPPPCDSPSWRLGAPATFAPYCLGLCRRKGRPVVATVLVAGVACVATLPRLPDSGSRRHSTRDASTSTRSTGAWRGIVGCLAARHRLSSGYPISQLRRTCFSRPSIVVLFVRALPAAQLAGSLVSYPQPRQRDWYRERAGPRNPPRTPSGQPRGSAARCTVRIGDRGRGAPGSL
jgi:hypothetical protein